MKTPLASYVCDTKIEGQIKVRLSLFTSQVAHQAGAKLQFHSMKQLGSFYPSLDGLQVHCKVTPECSDLDQWYLFIHLGEERCCVAKLLV